MGLFKDRGVAVGKPHCNSSIRTFNERKKGVRSECH
jgi:hypothetical protein